MYYNSENRNCQSDFRNLAYNQNMLRIFGLKLKELRKDSGFKQADLAIIFGVSKTTICQWETSKQEPSLEDIVKMAKFFKVSSDFLLGIDENQS